MRYDSFRYVYPPRPKNVVTPSAIPNYDNGKYLAQPKFNGSCSVLFTNGTETIFMNRHKEAFANMKLNTSELARLHRGDGWMILVGEYMNKSKKDKHGKTWNQKFVIFDVLAINSTQLIGKSFEERYTLLNQMFSKARAYDEYMSQVSDNVFLAKAFDTNLTELFNTITPIDMYEGLVIKSKTKGLETGVREENNTAGVVKVRKPTKNYIY